MSKTGTVQNCKNNYAVVFVPKDRACDSCPSCAGCAAKGIRVTVSNPIHAKPGDIVELSEGEKSSLPLATLVFVVPVLLPVLLYSWLSGINETLAVISVIASLILWGIAVFFVSRKLNKDPARTGKIIKILSEEVPE